jgi:hypothetical protein
MEHFKIQTYKTIIGRNIDIKYYLIDNTLNKIIGEIYKQPDANNIACKLNRNYHE